MTEKLNVGPLSKKMDEDQIKVAAKFAIEQGWDNLSITAEGDVVEHFGEVEDELEGEEAFTAPPMMGPDGPVMRVSWQRDGSLKVIKESAE